MHAWEAIYNMWIVIWLGTSRKTSNDSLGTVWGKVADWKFYHFLWSFMNHLFLNHYWPILMYGCVLPPVWMEQSTINMCFFMLKISWSFLKKLRISCKIILNYTLNSKKSKLFHHPSTLVVKYIKLCFKMEPIHQSLDMWNTLKQL